MTNSRFKRFISMLLSLVMIVSSTPIKGFSEETPAVSTIGITNTIHGDSSLAAKYMIELYDANGDKLMGENLSSMTAATEKSS